MRLLHKLLGIIDSSDAISHEIEDKAVRKEFSKLSKQSGKLTINGKTHMLNWTDLREGNESQLGHGGSGMVSIYYCGDQKIAVKELSHTQNIASERRILMDIQVIRRSVNCPNIVNCYGFFLTGYLEKICMEPMHCSVAKVIQARPEPVDGSILKVIAEGILRALMFLEKMNVVHNDIKPSNMLVNMSGEVKLCDFGLSASLKSRNMDSNSSGNRFYKAPELFGHVEYRPHSIKIDVWALGISLMEIATGRYPYNTKTFAMSIARPGETPMLHPSELHSPSLCHFVSRCLERPAEARANYRELLDHYFIRNTADGDIASWISVVP